MPALLGTPTSSQENYTVRNTFVYVPPVTPSMAEEPPRRLVTCPAEVDNAHLFSPGCADATMRSPSCLPPLQEESCCPPPAPALRCSPKSPSPSHTLAKLSRLPSPALDFADQPLTLAELSRFHSPELLDDQHYGFTWVVPPTLKELDMYSNNNATPFAALHSYVAPPQQQTSATAATSIPSFENKTVCDAKKDAAAPADPSRSVRWAEEILSRLTEEEEKGGEEGVSEMEKENTQPVSQGEVKQEQATKKETARSTICWADLSPESSPAKRSRVSPSSRGDSFFESSHNYTVKNTFVCVPDMPEMADSALRRLQTCPAEVSNNAQQEMDEDLVKAIPDLRTGIPQKLQKGVATSGQVKESPKKQEQPKKQQQPARQQPAPLKAPWSEQLVNKATPQPPAIQGKGTSRGGSQQRMAPAPQQQLPATTGARNTFYKNESASTMSPAPGVGAAPGGNRWEYATKFLCRFPVAIPAEGGDFRVVRRIFGQGGENMKHIAKMTKAKLRLRGRGSGFKEGPNNEESKEPLVLCVSAEDVEGYELAKELISELFDEIHDQYRKYTGPKPQIPEGKLTVRVQEHPGNPPQK